VPAPRPYSGGRASPPNLYLEHLDRYRLSIVASSHPGPPSAYEGPRRRPTAGELILAVVVPCILFISLQFIGLVLHVSGAARSGPTPGRTELVGTLGSVCSVVAWLVLLVGLARLGVKLRALMAMRAQP
jgi:hypothetical protein